MTAEMLSHNHEPAPDVLQALGGIAQRGNNEAISTDDTSLKLNISTLPAPQNVEARSFAIAANLVQGKFREIKNTLKADERDVQRMAAREDSVRLLFKTFGILPKTDEVNKPFSRIYRETEASIPGRDRSHIGDLAEKYADNPAISVLYLLQGKNSVPDDDIVFMRRIMLVLVDEHGA